MQSEAAQFGAPAEPAAPDWLGSAQWLHGTTTHEPERAHPADTAGPDDGYRPRWADDDPEPDGPLKRRWRSTPAAAIALVAVGLCATAIALYTAFASGGTGPQVPVNFPTTAGVAAPSTAVDVGGPVPESASAPAELVISVVGLVHRPGLVRLPPQARVADAISSAGGAKNGADLLSLNMAQPLRDGDQILVGFADPAGGVQMRSAVVPVDGSGGAGATTSPPTGSASAAPGSGGLVNINTATNVELDTLPGVGPVTAASIIAWRQANGSFASIDQLAEVDGIGPGRLEKLRDKVTV